MQQRWGTNIVIIAQQFSFDYLINQNCAIFKCNKIFDAHLSDILLVILISILFETQNIRFSFIIKYYANQLLRILIFIQLNSCNHIQMNITKILNTSLRSRLTFSANNYKKFYPVSFLQNKIVYRYLQCSNQGIQFLKKYQKLMKQQPSEAVQLLINNYPDIQLSVIKEINQLTICQKQVRYNIALQILNRYILKNYLDSRSNLVYFFISNLIQKDLSALKDFAQKHPENQEFYIVYFSCIMSLDYMSYQEELPRFNPNNDFLIYLAKLRKKQLKPETKVHLCRIAYMLKLDYEYYLQFANNLKMDIKTEQGIIAFQAIIWLFDKYQLIQEYKVEKWIDKIIHNFSQLDENLIIRAAETLLKMVKVDKWFSKKKQLVGLMVKAMLKDKKSIPYTHIVVKYSLSFKHMIAEVKQYANQNIPIFLQMIDLNFSKKQIINVYRYSLGKIPKQVIDQCIKNMQKKFDNFLNLSLNTKPKRATVIIFQEIYFLYKIYDQIEIKNIDQFTDKIVKLSIKITENMEYASPMINVKILQQLGYIQKALKIVQQIDATCGSQFVDIWVSILAFLDQNKIENFQPKYSIFQLGLKQFIKKGYRSNTYFQMFFFIDLSYYLVKYRNSPIRKSLQQLYKQDIENNLLACMDQIRISGTSFKQLVKLVAYYSKDNAKITRFIQENFILFIFDNRLNHSNYIQEILEHYKKFTNQNPKFIFTCEKIILDYKKRTIYASNFMNTFNFRPKYKQNIDRIKAKNERTSLKQQYQLNDQSH